MNGQQLKELLDTVYEKASKETAEKIWNSVYQIALNTRGDATLQIIKDFAKRDGVEIKIQNNTLTEHKPYFVRVAEIERERRGAIKE